MLLIYTPSNTSRFRYIIEVLFSSVLPVEYRLTSNKDDFIAYRDTKINYSSNRLSADEIWLEPHKLLFEKNISQQQTDCFTWQGVKAFFKTGGDIPFDIFAASFYLITRYEEYLPHTKDEYGRYAHANSIAHAEGFLIIPLVNIWMKKLQNSFRFPVSSFQLFTEDGNYFFNIAQQKTTSSVTGNQQPVTSNWFLPTYDIDIAYAYKGKDLIRNTGSFGKDLISGRLWFIKERIHVYSGIKPDPFDTFKWLDNLHAKYNLEPTYFFLLAEKNKLYDKNVSPHTKLMQRLVLRCAARYTVGIHPSWQSGDDENFLDNEIAILRNITNKPVQVSRQHYIRMTLPHTYRLLIAKGITEEYSMGYGSINGFRASVTSPFYWYDVEKDVKTNLLVRPYCYMEANSFFEQHYTAEQAAIELQQYHDVVKAVGGQLITIFHNHFVTEQPQWIAWREMYSNFLQINFG